MQARLFVPVFLHKKSLDLCYKLAKLTTPVLAPFALPIQCSAAHRQDRNIPPAHTIFSDFIVIGCEKKHRTDQFTKPDQTGRPQDDISQ